MKKHGIMVGLAVLCMVQPVWAKKQTSHTTSHDKPSPVAEARSDEVVLGDVEAYLNGLTTIEADFVQVSPDGSLANGRFFLQRPGKMRWQYEPPVPVLMVSAGTFLTYYDYELDQITNIPIESSLAGFLARPTISLQSKEITILERTRKDGVVRIRLTQAAKPEDGELTLELTDKPMQLRNLIIKDAQGQTTNVSLNNARYGMKLDKALFVPPSSLNKPARIVR
jgi:outer membrane lipoprotein-sorting protein